MVDIDPFLQITPYLPKSAHHHLTGQGSQQREAPATGPRGAAALKVEQLVYEYLSWLRVGRTVNIYE